MNLQKIVRNVFLCAIGLSCVACTPKPYTQHIGVVSDPSGADIYADGEFMGNTPASITLERNRNHFITIMKPGYKQENVPLSVVHDTNQQMMRSALAGLDSISSTKDIVWGIENARDQYEEDRETGKHSTLVPSNVAVTLQPSATNGQ